ncbi:transposable element Tcb1 transposase [Trichonephila clavipes]|nr:transposable element Tcb1 transposase [Trichonephila clavipes]
MFVQEGTPMPCRECKDGREAKDMGPGQLEIMTVLSQVLYIFAPSRLIFQPPVQWRSYQWARWCHAPVCSDSGTPSDPNHQKEVELAHRFTTLETISNYRNSYPGFSSGRPRGTTPADDRYIVLQARRNRRQTAGEIARHTSQATGRPISRFTVARRLHGGGLFARRPVRCVPLTPAHRRRRSLWCREHRNWRDNEWGRVLFTDESRFSLSSDSHRILIWRAGKPQSSLEHH